MIVCIDGPAGAGKSTAARLLATRLGFRFLDTGAMYRAVALAADRRNVPLDDAAALAELARGLDIRLDDTRVFVDGQDVTAEIRTPRITSLTHFAADNAAVRAHLVDLQRAAAGDDNVVAEGRDQGTVVFPRAACKIFLSASPAERARRRMQELSARGQTVDFNQLLAEQNLRDERDATREVGPLQPAADAVHMLTDGLTADEVVDRLEAVVRAK